MVLRDIEAAVRPPSPRCSPPAKSDVTALCLEMHDFWLAKALAGRPKDLAFCAALLDRGLVRRTVLKERLDDMPALDIERKTWMRPEAASIKEMFGCMASG